MVYPPRNANTLNDITAPPLFDAYTLFQASHQSPLIAISGNFAS